MQTWTRHECAKHVNVLEEYEKVHDIAPLRTKLLIQKTLINTNERLKGMCIGVCEGEGDIA